MLKVKGLDIRQLALASLGITIPETLKNSCLDEIKRFPESAWYKCEFRNCDLLLIYGGSDVIEKDNLKWASNDNKAIRQLIGQTIEPYFHCLPRLIVLRTPPDQTLNWHVDCSSEELDSFQPKMRILLQGKTDDLFFKSRLGKPLPVQTRGDVYYMSGAYIHALKNTSGHDRYVLCLGSPWGEADIKSHFLNLIEQQAEENLLWNSDLQATNRTLFVRSPREHKLTPYG